MQGVEHVAGLHGTTVGKGSTYGRLKSKVVGSVVEKHLEDRNRPQESHEQNTEATAAGCRDWLDVQSLDTYIKTQ